VGTLCCHASFVKSLNLTVAIARPLKYLKVTSVLKKSLNSLGMLQKISARLEILLQLILIGVFSFETTTIKVRAISEYVHSLLIW